LKAFFQLGLKENKLKPDRVCLALQGAPKGITEGNPPLSTKVL